MARRNPDGTVRRAPRPQVRYGGTEPIELIRYGREILAHIVHITSDIMGDHLDDPVLVKDAHDIIGDIDALQSVFGLWEHRLTEGVRDA